MKKKSVTVFILLSLLLIPFLPASVYGSSEIEVRSGFKPDDSQNPSFDSKTSKQYGSAPPATQDNCDFDEMDKLSDFQLNSNETNVWSDLANVSDPVKMVIGVNNATSNSYEDLMRLIVENGGELNNTVSIGGEIRAVVADIPFSAESSFRTKVRAAGLSSYIEPNMKFQACFVPNDPYWPQQWGPVKIEADYAWNTTTGDPSVLVAVIDTGIDWNHPDLAANYVALGYDWVNNDPDPMDDHGHGTHCAGIVGAVINNSIGIAGLAQVRIMAEKGLDWYGGGTEDDLANAIAHAVDQGADILSLSWGGYAESALIHEAIKYAYDAGVLVVAAAGNDATSIKHFPAGYDEVIAVSATDQYDNPAWFTNFGDWIELAAPGVNIYSTVWDNSYTYMSGTSMATPHVAGVAALVCCRFPNASRDWLWLWLKYTADDLGDPGFDAYYGYGRINARKAVELAPPEHDILISSWARPPYVEPGKLATVNTTVLNFGANDETDITVQLLANGSLIDSTLIDFLARGESVTVSCSWSPTDEGMYNLTSYVVPVPDETVTENNVVWAHVYVGFPMKAYVLDSAGTHLGEIIANWQVLNTNWHVYGDTMIYIDYTTLSIEDISYDDIAATGADVLIISCAYAWQFTDSEIKAITRYTQEGHGLIATAGTLYYGVPNNNKLAPLFGLSQAIRWTATWTDLLHLQDPTHPLFVSIPDPYCFREVQTVVPPDGRWDENELAGGTYVALGHYNEAAIVVNRGLVFISPWLEIIPAYYHFNLQLLYNAITWSSYQKPEHELVVSLDCPSFLKPNESMLLNATVSNVGLNNETDVQLQLLIDDTVVNSATISKLLTDASCTINYSWIPTVEATYNVTAYAPPVPEEDSTTNNIETKTVLVMLISGNVVFEEAHLPVFTIGNNPAYAVAGGYSGFAECLAALGCNVSTINPGTIVEPGILAPVDVLVIVAPHNGYLPSEIDTIETWVKSGGKLLLISDWGPFGGVMNTIAPRFNIKLKLDALFDYDENVGSPEWVYYDGANLRSHPITAGVSRVETYCGDGILSAPASEIPLIVTDSDGTAVWAYDGSPAIGVSVMSAIDGGTAGFGRLVIITDSNVWDSADDVDGDGDIDFYDSQNYILAINTIEWLAVKYEHELVVSVEAPAFLEPGGSSLLSASVYNHGLNNETDVELFLLINGTAVNNVIIPKLVIGSSYTLTYLWTSTVEGTYNVTAYAPLVPDEAVKANNLVSKVVHVCPIPQVALISDQAQLERVTYILRSMRVGYDIYDENSIYLYTEDLDLLLHYRVVIFSKYNRLITKAEHSALQSYLSSGGRLLVTGYDSLGDPSDWLLADIVRSSSVGNILGQPYLIVVDEKHPIMNGLYGSFPAGYGITGICSDCDLAEADTAREAITVAELANGYDKIIATDLRPGRVVYWNGEGVFDWTTNADCQAMFKNTVKWLLDRMPPVADAGPDKTVEVGASVVFDASGSRDDAGIMRYEWDFGDGTNGTGIITAHAYMEPGTYMVTLTVQDVAGNSDADSSSITALLDWLDVYTQKEPVNGKGVNASCDAFAPQEEVILYAYVSHRADPVQNKFVAFEVRDPTGQVWLYRSNSTDENGIATVSFRVPTTPIFGDWTVYATVDIAEQTLIDKLTFKVGWIVEITQVEAVDMHGNAKTSFARGEHMYFNITLRNIAFTSKEATITIVVYDESGVPIGLAILQDWLIPSGTTKIFVMDLQIPKWAYIGIATIHANAYTNLPSQEGTATCPEESTTFLID